MLLVVVHRPTLDDAAVARVAAATGLAMADVRSRLVGPTPRVLVVSQAAEPLHAMAAALVPLGLRTLVCDPACAPTDEDRLVPRSLAFHPEALVASDMTDTPHVCPWSAIGLIQHGMRSRVHVRVMKHKEARFSLTRTLLSGGMATHRTVEVEQKLPRHDIERFILLHRNDGQDDVMLYERRLQYQFLDEAMQPSSYANLEVVLARIRERTTARLEERIAHPGFVTALPKTSVDPLDLALYLVQLGAAHEA